jgi:hypothetical protein
MQFSASKYSEGILLLGEHHFHDGDRAFDWEGWNLRDRNATLTAKEFGSDD